MPRLAELIELTRVRVLLFLRETEAIFWVFLFPLVLAGVLGFAFRSSEPEATRIGLLPAPTAESYRELLEGGENLEAEIFSDRASAERALRKGVIQGLLQIPSVSGNDNETPSLRLDPNRPESEIARLRVARVLETKGRGQPASLAIEEVRENGSRYVDFLFPGLLGMNLMGTGMWMVGFAVAEMRQRKVLKRMLVTPMRRSSFVLSFMFSRLVFLALELGILVAFGCWFLGVPFRSNVLLFALACLLGAFTFTALGMLATSRARTIQGASGMLNLFMMPMWLCSGVFFSYERFPEFLHPILRYLPLSALNDALRELMLDGAGLIAIAPELLIQLAWLAITFPLSLKIFRWE